MAIREYVSDEWRDILRHNQADHFDQLWSLDDGNWFEPPNYRRGGWSGVVRTKFSLPNNSDAGVFIKRQENHVYRSWLNLFRPAATLEREFLNLQSFRKSGIPTLELIYFGQRRIGGNLQAIVVTRELDGYLPLNDKSLLDNLQSDPSLRRLVLSKVAQVIKHMHDKHMQHNCLYPKHIFVKCLTSSNIDVRLIDLEKVKWQPFRRHAMLRDLGTLHRHMEACSKTDRLRFFLAYRQENRLSKESRKILIAVLRRTRLKGAVR